MRDRLLLGLATLSLLTLFVCDICFCDSLIFHASFDEGLKADISYGNPEPIAMEGKVSYHDGISGKSVAVGISNGENREGHWYKYDAGGNISASKGTVSMFVNPMDWRGDDKYFHLFFQARGEESRLIIYKYIDTSHLYFVLGTNDDKSLTLVNTNIGNWKPGEWHHITCSWDEKTMNLYVDGRLKNSKQIRVHPASEFKEFAIGGFNPKGWGDNPIGMTLIDELKIYNEIISPLEMKNVQKDWQRPLLVVGETWNPPSIDGVINPEEYSFAGTGFFDIARGIYALEQSHYYIAYDKNNLYIGVVTPIIEDKLRSEVKIRDGSEIWHDDVIELFISPVESGGDVYHFIFNSYGTLYDEKNRDVSWDIETIHYTNKITNNKWTLEAAIPFTALGITHPSKKDVWSINICRSFSSSKYYTSATPVKGSYHDVENFLRMQFYPDAPIVNLSNIGELLTGKIAMDLSIENRVTDKEQVDISVDLELEGQSLLDYQKSFLIARGEKLSIPVTKEKEWQFSGKGGSRIVDGQPIADYGEGNLKLCINSSRLGTLYAISYPFLIGEPFKYLYLYTKPGGKYLVIDIQQLELTRGGNPLILRCRLFDAKGAAVLEQNLQTAKYRYEVELNIESLPAGDYKIEMTLLDVDGNEISVARENYRKYPSYTAPVWKNNKIGITNRVPSPWTPLQVRDGRVVKCWGREYHFDNGLFPKQIVSQGNELLASPITLRIEEEDRDATQIVKADAEWKDTSDKKVRRLARSRIGSIDVTTDITIEYDGFMWIEIKLMSSIETKIQKMVLDIPLRQEAATLVNSGNPHLINTGKLSNEKWTKNLAEKPIFWVGNETAGLQWFAQDLKNWHIDDLRRSAEILPGEKIRTVRINIVDNPLVLNKPRDIVFGIQATPVKPKTVGWRNWKMGWFSHNKEYNMDPWVMIFELYNYPDTTKLLSGIKPIYGIDNMNRLRDRGVRVLPYVALQGTSPFSPEYKYYGESWRNTLRGREPYGADDLSVTWLTAFICLNSDSYRDFYLWKLNSAIQELDLQGLYFDWGHIPSCDNPEHGCGWHDDKGYPHPTYSILGSRKLAERVYTVMKEHDPLSVIIYHISGEISMPVHSFADAMLDGESLARLLVNKGKKGYYNLLSLDKFRAAYMSHNWGPVMTFLPEFTNAARMFKPEMESFWDSEESLPQRLYLAGLILLHDSQVWPIHGLEKIYRDIWKIQDEFGWDDTVEFFPYWNNCQQIQIVSPQSSDIVASVFKRGNKFMIVPFNNTDEKVISKIHVNLENLGFTKDRTVELEDRLGGEKFTIKSGVVSVPLDARGFRMLVTSD